ncbi:MAG TPA: prepilin peptidase, partial [Thermodesulfobacteriota bacterium]|nr:prepilin peptidase [Thermodesulfobacteriota bacterium]
MADTTTLIVPFLFGAVVGSFLNVCIYRIPQGISIVSPPSRCPVCKRRIPFYFNVPIISYFLLRGRCAYCKTPLSPQYPLVEALTGAFAVILFARFGVTP